NNPLVYIDPSGMNEVCGFYVWLYTGSWCIDEQHYNAAMNAAGLSVIKTAKCLWNCEVTIHASLAAQLGLPAGGAAHLAFTHLEVAKPSDLQLAGWPDRTTLQRILAQRFRERGWHGVADRMHRAATRVSTRPATSAVGSIVKGVVIVECLFAIGCSIKCYFWGYCRCDVS